MSSRILVVDDEESIRFAFSTFLTAEGHRVDVAQDLKSAMSRIEETVYDLVFVDLMLGSQSGLDLLRSLQQRDVGTLLIVITGFPDVISAAESVRLNAYDYIAKPIKKPTLLRVTSMALKHKSVVDRNLEFRANLEAIFQSVSEGILLVDDDLRVVEVNPSAAEICSLSREELVGTSLTAIAPSLLEVVSATIENREPREMSRFEFVPQKGLRRVVSLSTAPVQSTTTGQTGAVLVLRDETRLDQLERSLQERQRFHKLVGESPPMQRLYAMLANLSDLPTTVLIVGESGTGKELAAEALHYAGIRREGPLVKVNCSALSDTLLESELFGHVKGAFTGAVADKVGRFERANGGTILLDEIGDISSRMQMRLLRVLQEREFERVGSSVPIKVDVRVVAATNKNLATLVAQGDFREDLYYRINVVPLEVPPLRERRSDLPILIQHLIARFNTKLNKSVTGVAPDVMRRFWEYPWPGNVRELEHALEHAMAVAGNRLLSVADLPPALSTRRPEQSDSLPAFETAAGEKQGILLALQKTAGNKARAARLLGISRRTLYRKIQKHQLS